MFCFVSIICNSKRKRTALKYVVVVKETFYDNLVLLNRRTYRQLLFSCDKERFQSISGVILFEETLFQKVISQLARSFSSRRTSSRR